MLFNVKEIYQETEKISQLDQVKVGGWVKSVRHNKFIELNDGSYLSNLQVVCPLDLAEKIKKINFGSSLIVRGKLILTPGRAQSCELQTREIEFIGPNSLNWHEDAHLPWINSGALTNLYFLTEYTPPSKLVSEKAQIECQLPAAQPQSVLISDIDLNPSKIVWVSPRENGTHVWTLLGTHVWTLLGTDVYANATLFFTLRLIDFKAYASGSIINHLQRSALMSLEVDWVTDPQIQTHFLTLLNSPLAKIKNLHSKIKNLLLRKYFR